MATRAKRRSTTRKSDGRPSRATAEPDLWQRGKWWFVGGGLAAGIALLVALTFALGGPERPEITGQEFGLGEAPPDVTLATLDGDFQVSNQQGEALLLYFSFPG